MPKSSNSQALKNAIPRKNKLKFAGKPQGWQHWLTNLACPISRWGMGLHYGTDYRDYTIDIFGVMAQKARWF